jgi:NAD dependent epimerase/dehydratase
VNWSGKKVLVTGAGGFIGSHLAERLVELGASTRALVHYNGAGSWGWLDGSSRRLELEGVLGDVRDPESVRRAMADVDVVFHLAALIAIPYSYEAPRSYVQTNVEGTLNVLQAARDLGTGRVVHTSTSEVYGTALYVPIDEKHPLQGQSPYSASKIGADKMAEAFYRSFGVPVVTVRPFNTFGPRQSARAVIPTVITQALTRREVKLGSLTPLRDFNFVSDTVEGFLRCAESDAALGQVVNIGSGREITIGDMVELVRKLLGADVVIAQETSRIRPAQSEVDRLCADNRVAAALVGWRPQTSLETGLAKTIEWLKGNLDRYKVDRYVV